MFWVEKEHVENAKQKYPRADTSCGEDYQAKETISVGWFK